MAIVKRGLEEAIKRYLDSQDIHNNVLLLSGARQVGKTTLLSEFLKNKNAISVNLFDQTRLPREIDATGSFEEFERVLLRELNFKPSEGTILVFDEAQEAKQLGRWIQFMKEKWSRQKVIISGSILSNMFENNVPYPVGRVEEITLRPFTFKEYLSAIHRNGLIEILEKSSFEKPLSEADRRSFIEPYLDYLQTGGMPEIVIKAHDGAEDLFVLWDRLLRHYALDVERYMEEVYKSMFIAAMDRIADITCQPIKNSQIISISSPSYRKLPRLLEIMEKWHLVHKIASQTKHPESSGGMASKRYLFDIGLVNFFINHSQRVEWKERSDSGNLVYPKLQENFVCNEIIADAPHPISALTYYKETRNSREIDFLVSVAGRVFPLEVKSQSSYSRNSLIPMVNFLEQNDLSEGILVYNGQMKSFKFKGKTIHAIPPFFVSELDRVL